MGESFVAAAQSALANLPDTELAFVTTWPSAAWTFPAVPVFGPGGEVVAAIELTVAELDHDLHPIIGPLTIASRSLSRDIASGGHPN